MSQILELASRPPFVLRVEGTDYNVEYPVPAVAALEAKLNRSMRSFADWLNIRPHELADVLEAGLQRCNSEKAKEIAEVVCGSLPAEEIETVIEALCTTTFPKATERYKQAVAAVQQRTAEALAPAVTRTAVDGEAADA